MMKLSIAAGLALMALTTVSHAAGDIAEGEKAFKKCAACHAVGPDAKNKVGPVLNGIVGRPIASIADFKYSPAMTEFGAGKVWDEANLTGYLADPKGFVPKNKMAFVGLKKEEELKGVIAYLAQYNADGSKK
ncbi:c-type cytochrome [Pannonibacter tanglangensis]|uniref:C-type cytochrome n=1 Tax=Pannonibacter tanglangensis TaxID=2750084 RepID=A0ABW9ZKC5_9HYPH|nr:cytochrome c family protein [Pannonibacter sp. XCT-34]NBN64513.1 c-type cytochrome [Pannonibacter sp. XCT-34]